MNCKYRNTLLALTLVSGVCLTNITSAGSPTRAAATRYHVGSVGAAATFIQATTRRPQGLTMPIALQALVADIGTQRRVQLGRHRSREAALQHIRQQYPVHQRRIAPTPAAVPIPSNAAALQHHQSRSALQTTVTTRVAVQAPSNAVALEMLRQQYPGEQIRTHNSSQGGTTRTRIERRIGTAQLRP